MLWAIVAPLVLTWTAGTPADDPSWTTVESGVKARLRGVSAVDATTVWASGTAGTVIRTTDGGRSWTRLTVPGAGALDFRDIQAFDARVAVAMAAGPGEQSRIYRTEDGGQRWSLALTCSDPAGFFDALAFWDRGRGLVLSDPVDGRFRLFRTSDGGRTWQPIDPAGMPLARSGEGAFAASGTCLVALAGTRTAWFGTGGAGGGRVFRSDDEGATWSAVGTGIAATRPSEGIFSLAFRDAQHGLAIGGDYQHVDQRGPYLARTNDGGRNWSLVSAGPGGYRSCLAFGPGRGGVLAVGAGGASWSSDERAGWTDQNQVGFHALSARDGTLWAVGDDGRVAHVAARAGR